MKSVLIKDTTKEERIQIVTQGLSQCGGACDFCNACDNIGGGIALTHQANLFQRVVLSKLPAPT